MGRIYCYGELTGDHEGWTEYLTEEGEWRSGFDSMRPCKVLREVEGLGTYVSTWRAACKCGWADEPMRVLRLASADPFFLGEESEEDEYEMVIGQWEQHMAPLVAVAEVWDADDAVKDAQDDLRLAVIKARGLGASWTDLGRALGVTKQAAQQRFGT